MIRVPIARLIAAALVLHSLSAAADTIELDLRGAVERARRFAADAVAARGGITEAEAGVRGADVVFTTDPDVELGAGPRLVPGHPLDGEVRIEQSLEPWRHAPRRRVAAAGLRRATAEADRAARAVELEAALAFHDAVFAERAVALARHAGELAQRAAEVAARRRQAGDITDLEANLARAAAGRAAAAALAADGDRAVAVGRLAALIGAGPGDAIALRGELAPGSVPALDELRRALATRADLRVLDGDRAVAAAERDQAVAAGRPDLAAWAAYQREDGTDIVVGGLRLSLPLWGRTRGDQAAATARERRATAVHDATLRAAGHALAGATAALASAQQAVDAFERDVAPLLDDSERLLQRRIDANQIAISDYLVARQELVTGRREHLERRLALARAAATVRFLAGVSP